MLHLGRVFVGSHVRGFAIYVAAETAELRMAELGRKKPPGPSSFRFEVASLTRLLVEVTGVLDDAMIDNLIPATVEALATTSEIKQVVLDLRTIEDCTPGARGGLSSLQKLLARRRLRAAWLVSTPRMQGVAKAIIVGVADQQAASFGNMQQAEAWFDQGAGRIEGIIDPLRRPR